MVALNAKYAPAWSLQGDLETWDNNLTEAEAAYTKAAENRADNLADILNRALVRIQEKHYEAAQKDIDGLKKRAPQHAGINYAQGLIYFQTDRMPEAKEAFEFTLRANNKHTGAMYYLSLINMRLGNRQQAEAYGSQLLAITPNSIPARKLMATINLENRKYAAAEELIRPVVTYREDDIEALNLLANALLNQNKTDEAIGLLEKVAGLQPDSAVAQLRLGVGLLTGGKQSQGIEHIRKALALDPQFQQADVALVVNYLNQKELEKALVAAKDYRDRHPDSVTPYNLIGRVALALGQDAVAKESFEHARKIAPGNPEASYNLAEMAISKKAYMEARQYYQDVLDHHENDLMSLVKLAYLDALDNKEQAMLEHLQQALAAHPSESLPKVMLARYYLRQGSPAKVPELMLDLSDDQKQDAAVLEVMAQSQLSRKQYQDAKQSVEQLLAQQSNSAQAHFLLAQVYAGLGNRTDTKQELESVIKLSPKHFAAHLALARLLAQEGQNEKVTEQLTVLNEISPDNPDVLALKASLAQAQGDQKTASTLLQDVFEQIPSTASMLAVARQELAMGNQMASLELQKQWMTEHPDDLVASMALADAYINQNQVERAITLYQRVLEQDEQNVNALNNLAWHLRDKEPVKALQYAKRAVALAPESAEVMDTLSVVLLKNNDIKSAKRYTERALAKKPKDPSFRYHSAMIDTAAGDKTSAIETLQSLLAEGSNFSEKTEAQELLAKLKAGG